LSVATTSATTTRLDLYRQIARQLRADSIRSSTAAGSGHPTSSLSAADLMAVLLSGHLRYDWKKPKDPANDHLIFSKGHASTLLFDSAARWSEGEPRQPIEWKIARDASQHWRVILAAGLTPENVELVFSS